MTVAAMGGAAGGGGNSANLQLATITNINLFTFEITCKIDGSDSTCSVLVDQARRAVPATVGDRILVTRVGSQMYEIACVQSAYFAPGTPFASYGLSADQSVPTGAATQILFNTALQPLVGFGAPVFGVFTIPTTGLYMMTARINWATTAAVARRFAAFTINATLDTRNEQANSGTGNWFNQVTDIKQLTAGDTVGVQGFHTAAAAVNALAFDSSGTVPGTTIKIAKIG